MTFRFSPAGTEQILALPVPKPSRDEAWYIAVIPTAATGASCVLRELPRIIVWAFPDKLAGTSLGGMMGGSSRGKDRVIDVFERVVNDRSEAYGKRLLKYDKNVMSFSFDLVSSDPKAKPSKRNGKGPPRCKRSCLILYDRISLLPSHWTVLWLGPRLQLLAFGVNRECASRGRKTAVHE